MFKRVVASFGAALLALSVATTTQFAGATTAEAAQKSAKKSTEKQARKKSKRVRKKPRGGTRYNFGTWDRDTTYEGYCDNSYRIGIPTVSCQDFHRH